MNWDVSPKMALWHFSLIIPRHPKPWKQNFKGSSQGQRSADSAKYTTGPHHNTYQWLRTMSSHCMTQQNGKDDLAKLWKVNWQTVKWLKTIKWWLSQQPMMTQSVTSRLSKGPNDVSAQRLVTCIILSLIHFTLLLWCFSKWTVDIFPSLKTAPCCCIPDPHVFIFHPTVFSISI